MAGSLVPRSFLPFSACDSRLTRRDDAFNKPLLPPMARSLRIIASCSTARTTRRARARAECPIGFIVIYPAEVTFHHFLVADRRPGRDGKTASSLHRQQRSRARVILEEMTVARPVNNLSSPFEESRAIFPRGRR